MPSEIHESASDVPRAAWPRLLGALPAERVVHTARALCADFRVEPLLSLAEGVGLLRMRESCFGEHYHLGEFLLAQAALELVAADGQRFAGGARVMSGSAEYAEALAMLDALLAHGLPGCEAVRQLLAEGGQQLERVEARRSEIRERTRVDFSLLSSASRGSEDDSI